MGFVRNIFIFDSIFALFLFSISFFSSNRVRYFDTLFQFFITTLHSNSSFQFFIPILNSIPPFQSSIIPILRFDPIFQFNKFLSIRYCVVHRSVYTIVLIHIVCPTARGLKRPLSRDFSYVLIDQSMSYGFSNNYSIISQVFNKSIEFSIDYGLVVQSCNVVF